MSTVTHVPFSQMQNFSSVIPKRQIKWQTEIDVHISTSAGGKVIDDNTNFIRMGVLCAVCIHWFIPFFLFFLTLFSTILPEFYFVIRIEIAMRIRMLYLWSYAKYLHVR